LFQDFKREFNLGGSKVILEQIYGRHNYKESQKYVKFREGRLLR
jgi:hypothetical protein